MSVFVRNAGVWKRTKDVHVNVGGTWKSTVDVIGGGSKVKVAAGWKDATAAEDQTAGVITQGEDFLYNYTYTFSPYSQYAVTARGYNSASDNDYEWQRTIAFGSMTLGADFWDSRGELRVIAAIYKVSYFELTILLTLDGNDIPNDDRTFKSMSIQDDFSTRVHLRSDAFYIGNTNNGSTWYWDNNISGTPPQRNWGTGDDLTVTFQFGQ